MKKIYFVSLLTALLLAFSSSTLAAWYYTQGTSGHIEWKANIAAAARDRAGWGLDFSLRSGRRNWVHFAVPTLGNWNKGARYIKLKFYTGSVDADVTDIHVYNGSVKVFTKAVNYSNGWRTVTIDMGSKKRFTRGLGISIGIAAGVESMSHRFMFSSAGANFVNM